MATANNFMNRFRRVTYSGRYLPEIDGLRFIAIFLVVGFAHLSTYVEQSVAPSLGENGPAQRFFLEGTYGVSIFFIISGFILSLPFAENKLRNGKPVSLKAYLWRRVTRLEPAYIITLTGYFVLRVWLFKYETFSELLPHFFASLFYVHNIVYDAHSAVNGVAWSLEVEIQFYLLMPLLSYLYHIKNTTFRRSIFLILIIAGTIFSYQQQYHIANILNKGCYFFGGMLLADLYLLNKKDFNSIVYTFTGAVFLIASLFIHGYYESVFLCLLKLVIVFVFFFLVLTNNTLKKWMSTPVVAITGGMCYSIYLLHIGVFGILRHGFAQIHFSDINWLNISIHCMIALAAVLIVSGIFFLLVEKPTMKRDWYKKIFSKKAL